MLGGVLRECSLSSLIVLVSHSATMDYRVKEGSWSKEGASKALKRSEWCG